MAKNYQLFNRLCCRQIELSNRQQLTNHNIKLTTQKRRHKTMYKIQGQPVYRRSANRTEVNLYQDYPIRDMQMFLSGDWTGKTHEEIRQESKRLLSMEFSPLEALQTLEEKTNELQKLLDEIETKTAGLESLRNAVTEGNEVNAKLKETAASVQSMMLELTELMYNKDKTAEELTEEKKPEKPLEDGHFDLDKSAIEGAPTESDVNSPDIDPGMFSFDNEDLDGLDFNINPDSSPSGEEQLPPSEPQGEVPQDLQEGSQVESQPQGSEGSEDSGVAEQPTESEQATDSPAEGVEGNTSEDTPPVESANPESAEQASGEEPLPAE